MKKIGLKFLSAAVLAVLAITGCQDKFQSDKGQIAKKLESAVSEDEGQTAEELKNIVSEDKGQIVEELKIIVSKEAETFLENADLSDVLGIGGSEQSELEKSVRSYIDDYELDEDAIEDAKAAVQAVLEDAKGLSAEEIEGRIASVFKK